MTLELHEEHGCDSHQSLKGHPLQGVGRGCTCMAINPSPLTRRFLQTAEMVKPSTPSPSHESSSSAGSDEGTEYYPHLGESCSGARGVARQEDLGEHFCDWERGAWASP